jgi:hypothetical protein
MDPPGDETHDGQMFDHELFLLGSEQIARARPERFRGRVGGSFVLRAFRWGEVYEWDILCRSITLPGTLLAFSRFLHDHHPAIIEPKIVGKPRSDVELTPGFRDRKTFVQPFPNNGAA